MHVTSSSLHYIFSVGVTISLTLLIQFYMIQRKYQRSGLNIHEPRCRYRTIHTKVGNGGNGGEFKLIVVVGENGSPAIPSFAIVVIVPTSVYEVAVVWNVEISTPNGRVGFVLDEV